MAQPERRTPAAAHLAGPAAPVVMAGNSQWQARA